MKTKPNDQDILRAYDWYAEHSNHVDSLTKGLTRSFVDEYPPSGSDCNRPELWKPAHWKWLLMGIGNKILAQEIRRLKDLLKNIRFAEEDKISMTTQTLITSPRRTR